jgi:hypothetical protein
MNKHTDWAEAERDADQWAGDNDMIIAVVEDFTEKPAVLLVMPDAEAQAYILDPERDAEIQYVANGPLPGGGFPCQENQLYGTRGH